MRLLWSTALLFISLAASAQVGISGQDSDNSASAQVGPSAQDSGNSVVAPVEIEFVGSGFSTAEQETFREWIQKTSSKLAPVLPSFPRKFSLKKDRKEAAASYRTGERLFYVLQEAIGRPVGVEKVMDQIFMSTEETNRSILLAWVSHEFAHQVISHTAEKEVKVYALKKASSKGSSFLVRLAMNGFKGHMWGSFHELYADLLSQIYDGHSHLGTIEDYLYTGRKYARGLAKTADNINACRYFFDSSFDPNGKYYGDKHESHVYLCDLGRFIWNNYLQCNLGKPETYIVLHDILVELMKESFDEGMAKGTNTAPFRFKKSGRKANNEYLIAYYKKKLQGQALCSPQNAPVPFPREEKARPGKNRAS